MKSFKNRFAQGFTLIEMVVAITVSGIILGAVLTSYAGLLRNKQRIDHYRHVQNAATLGLSRIADKVRDHGIGYSLYSGSDASAEADVLYIGPFEGADGELHTAAFELTDGTIVMSLDDEQAPMSGAGVEITGTFDVQPDTIPAPGEGPILTQPKVHINLRVKSTADPRVVLDVQTTLSSRQYR